MNISDNASNIEMADFLIQYPALKATQVFTILLLFPINCYVIWLIVKRTGNGLEAELFILNLCFCEIFFCFECALAFFGNLSYYLLLLMYIIDGITASGFPQLQCLICVERYLAVVHPVTFLKYKPLRYRLICSAIVWVSGLVSAAVNMIAVLQYMVPLYFGYVSTQFLIFLSIQVFCLVAVLRALKQSGPGDGKKEVESHIKKTAFDLILITTVTMLILYVSYGALLVPQWFSYRYFYTLSSVSYILFALAGLVQPLLFLYRVGKLSFMK